MIFAAVLVAAVATATPAPSPTPIPLGTFTHNGYLRAYDFQRINAVGTNQSAFNVGVALHGEFAWTNTPWSIGATYFGANPLGANGPNPQVNPRADNTLPAFAYSSLGELYLQYRGFRDFAQLGKMQLDTPWANAADGRLIPVTFQGVSYRHYFTGGWDLAVSRVARFKNRTSSTFDANNLLTQATTSGFLFAALSRTAGNFTGSFSQYWFWDIACMSYLELREDFTPRNYLATQMLAQSDAGRSLTGVIHNHTYGLQYGQRIGVFNATASYNYIPAVTYITRAPGTIFVPAGGTPTTRALGGGIFAVAGGGVASPYTDGYFADPLFTRMIAASLVERRSTGSAYRVALSANTKDGRLSGSLAHAFFDYSNQIGIATATATDADFNYLLSKPSAVRAFTGFSLRQRWAYRTSNTAPFRFLYSRTQLQYSF